MEGVWILPPVGKPYSLLRENHSIEVFPQEGCNYLQWTEEVLVVVVLLHIHLVTLQLEVMH